MATSLPLGGGDGNFCEAELVEPEANMTKRLVNLPGVYAA